jgi:hypothetical protein
MKIKKKIFLAQKMAESFERKEAAPEITNYIAACYLPRVAIFFSVQHTKVG